MKKLPIILLAVYTLLTSCSSKITCQEAKDVWLVFSASGTDYLGTRDSTADSVTIIARYTKNTGMKQAYSIDTFTSAHPLSVKNIMLSRIYADKYNWDYRITFLPTGRQYVVTELMSHDRQERIDNRDVGHSSYGVCYKDVTAKVNGTVYIEKSGANLKMIGIKF